MAQRFEVTPACQTKTMFIAKLKPDASLSTRVLMAALLWSGIGLMLVWRGTAAIVGSNIFWLVPLALLLGLLKSLAVLDRVVAKNMGRIVDKGEYSCLGGIYSWKTWLLVVAMVLLGKLLRASALPAWLVGTLYLAVGCSLSWSSRKAWSRWRSLAGIYPADRVD